MTSSTAGQIRAEYDDDDAVFWAWLQQQVSDPQYQIYRGLPLPFVKQLCKLPWNAYVNEQVDQRLRAKLNEAVDGIVQRSRKVAARGLILDEAWQFDTGKPR